MKKLLLLLLLAACGSTNDNSGGNDGGDPPTFNCDFVEVEPNNAQRDATPVGLFQPPTAVELCGNTDPNRASDWFQFFAPASLETSMFIQSVGSDTAILEVFIVSNSLTDTSNFIISGHFVSGPGQPIVILGLPTIVQDNGFFVVFATANSEAVPYHAEVIADGWLTLPL